MARYRCAAIVIVVMLSGAVLHAQSAPEHLRRADEAYNARKADEALMHLLRAITMDPANYRFLGADLLESANWDEAQLLLEDAARVDPVRITHRLALAGIYADRGDKPRARALYVWIASAPLVDPNDDLYKRQAAERLGRLGS